MFNQNIFENRLHNPAAFGSDERGVQLAHRRQFLGLEAADAPASLVAIADLSEPLRLSARKVGLGFSVVQDNVHITRRTCVGLSFSYHLLKNDWLDLALGLSAGVGKMGINTTGRRINDASDASLFEIDDQKANGFSAGPGLYFRATNYGTQGLKINLTMPQLFGNELEFDRAGASFLPKTHLLGSISYRHPVGAFFQVEPALMFRKAISDKHKAGRVDLAARLHFMDGKFWAGGGARFSNMPGGLHGGFGFRPIPQFSIAADYENHAQLGGSFEVVLDYYFTKNKKSDAPNHSGNFAKKSEARQVAKAMKINLSKIAGISDQAGQQKSTLAIQAATISTAIEAAASASSPNGFQGHTEKARLVLENSRANLLSLQSLNNRSETVLAESKTMAATLFPAGSTLPIMVGMPLGKIELTAQNVKNAHTEASEYFEMLQKKVADLEKKSGENWDLKKLVATGDLESAALMLQKEVDTLHKRPTGLSPVKVVKEDGWTTVVFRFPEVSESFDLRRELKDTRWLMTYIGKKTREWQANGIFIESITVRAELATPAARLKEKTHTSNPAEGLNAIKYTFFDKELDGGTRGIERTVEIPKETLDFEKLVLMKSNAMTKTIEQFGSSMLLTKIEMSVGNAGQKAAQEYVVEVKIR